MCFGIDTTSQISEKITKRQTIHTSLGIITSAACRFNRVFPALYEHMYKQNCGVCMNMREMDYSGLLSFSFI